jgi:hypothetical protein
LITFSSTSQDVPDDVLLFCFASHLVVLHLETRLTLATPDIFRLFAAILVLLPPPHLVDAICLTIDTALRDPPQQENWARFITPDKVNTSFDQEICSGALAKSLCDLVALGTTYASSTLFGALRYFVDTRAFKTLVATDYAKLIRLCDSDDTGLIRIAAYTALPFPKPDFPLVKECLLSVLCASFL